MDDSRHQALLAQLQELVRSVVSDLGLELVELNLKGPSRKRLLRLDVDRAGPSGITHEDCKVVTEAVSEAIDRTEAILGSYVLEVSSPGVDRPIRSMDDVRRNVGRKIVVRTSEPIDGRSDFRGVLRGGDPAALHLVEPDEHEVRIPLDRIEHAQQDVGF